MKEERRRGPGRPKNKPNPLFSQSGLTTQLQNSDGQFAFIFGLFGKDKKNGQLSLINVSNITRCFKETTLQFVSFMPDLSFSLQYEDFKAGESFRTGELPPDGRNSFRFTYSPPKEKKVKRLLKIFVNNQLWQSFTIEFICPTSKSRKYIPEDGDKSDAWYKQQTIGLCYQFSDGEVLSCLHDMEEDETSKSWKGRLENAVKSNPFPAAISLIPTNQTILPVDSPITDEDIFNLDLNGQVEVEAEVEAEAEAEAEEIPNQAGTFESQSPSPSYDNPSLLDKKENIANLLDNENDQVQSDAGSLETQDLMISFFLSDSGKFEFFEDLFSAEDYGEVKTV